MVKTVKVVRKLKENKQSKYMYRFNERIWWYIQFIQFNMVSINTMCYVDFLSDDSALPF